MKVTAVERVRVPAPVSTAVIVVPPGMPKSVIVWPTSKAPESTLRLVIVSEPESRVAAVPLTVEVAGFDSSRVPAPTEAIVVPAGMPGPEIASPAWNAPSRVTRFVTVLEPEARSPRPLASALVVPVPVAALVSPLPVVWEKPGQAPGPSMPKLSIRGRVVVSASAAGAIASRARAARSSAVARRVVRWLLTSLLVS